MNGSDGSILRDDVCCETEESTIFLRYYYYFVSLFFIIIINNTYYLNRVCLSREFSSLVRTIKNAIAHAACTLGIV